MILSQPSGDSEEESSVNIKGITLSNTSWTIQGLSLFVKESHLEKVRFFIEQNSTSHKYAKEVRIVNSTFGHMNIRSGYDIHVSDCTVDGNTMTSNSTLLDVVDGTLSVSNSSFQHLTGDVAEGPGLLTAVRCRIHILGVNCFNNKAVGGLIQVQDGSELFVQNSAFMNNGYVSSPSSVISMKFNSSLFISDSLFSGNAASNGSCFYLHHNVSVTISQSSFVNNTAVNGGVIYQNYESANISGQNKNTKPNYTKPDHAQSNFTVDGRIHKSPTSFCTIVTSHFRENKARCHFEGSNIDLLVRECDFIGNHADKYGGAIYTKNLTGTVALQQCLFTNSSATMGDSLAVVGTHTQVMSCGFLGGDPRSTLSSNVATIYLEYATLNTDKCTFNERAVRSIDAYGSKINIADSRFYGKRSSCISWGDCQINIVRSQFAAHTGVVLSTINWSNLTVVNTSFVYVFKTGVGTDQVEFINCWFHTRAGFVLVCKTLFKNCTISGLKEQLIWTVHSIQLNLGFEDLTGSAQLDIVDCVIMGNSISDDRFIYVRNVSFTMSNCLYSGNDVRNHLLLNGTTDVKINNVTFFNNSLGGNDDPGNDKSLLTMNNTIMEISKCVFESNCLQHGSLMFV